MGGNATKLAKQAWTDSREILQQTSRKTYEAKLAQRNEKITQMRALRRNRMLLEKAHREQRHASITGITSSISELEDAFKNQREALHKQFKLPEDIKDRLKQGRK